jgi:hypothetical protein
LPLTIALPRRVNAHVLVLFSPLEHAPDQIAVAADAYQRRTERQPGQTEESD